jgi:hypothetical protein
MTRCRFTDSAGHVIEERQLHSVPRNGEGVDIDDVIYYVGSVVHFIDNRANDTFVVVSLLSREQAARFLGGIKPNE